MVGKIYDSEHPVRRAGFTLIELLVTISIISVLMGILVPSMARARDKARTTICMTNLRGIHQGLTTFAMDNRDRLPPKYELKKNVLNAKEIAEGKLLNTLEDGIQIALTSYTVERLFRCPSDIGSFEDNTPVWQRRGTSYDVKGVPPKDYNNPAKADYWSRLDKNADIATDVFKPWDAEDIKKVQDKISKGEMGPIAWHNGVLNMAMARGHIVSVRTKAEEEQAKGKAPKAPK